MTKAKDIYGKEILVVSIIGNVCFIADGSVAHVTKVFVNGAQIRDAE